MKYLAELLRNLVYLLAKPRQAGSLVAMTVLSVTGYNVATSTNGLALFNPVQHILHLMVYLIGSAVVLNVILKHWNELLERLVDEGCTTRVEAGRTAGLLKRLLGIPPKNSESTQSDSKSDTPNNSRDLE
jgi:hypothetical protein